MHDCPICKAPLNILRGEIDGYKCPKCGALIVNLEPEPNDTDARIEALENQLAELRRYLGAIYWLDVHIGYRMKRGTITLEIDDHAKLMDLVYPRVKDETQ